MSLSKPYSVSSFIYFNVFISYLNLFYFRERDFNNFEIFIFSVTCFYYAYSNNFQNILKNLKSLNNYLIQIRDKIENFFMIQYAVLTTVRVRKLKQVRMV